MKKSVKFIFPIYIFLLITVVIFKIFPNFTICQIHYDIKQSRANGYINLNLIPFKTIVFYVKQGFELFAVKNLIGNVIPFIPMGFLLPFYLKKHRLLKTAVISLIFIFICETIQLFFMLGYFDVDDIILNFVGVVLGFFICTPILSILK